jgi:hypothetical protein
MSRSSNSSKELLKWHLLRIWFPESRPKHYKYCICICPKRRWFFFIDSEPPFARKAKEIALPVSSYEVTPLTRECYIDTTVLVEVPDDGRIQAALADDKCHYGFISPSLKKRILEAVNAHSALTAEERAAVLED